MFTKVLIANRGAIACRIIRTLKKLGIKSVAVYSEADLASLHVAQADEAVCIGRAPAAESYLRGEKILEVARATGAQAIHPGYGFLSENADFARSLRAGRNRLHRPVGGADARLRLEAPRARVGPAEQACRCCRAAACCPIWNRRVREAMRIGYPVMLKSTAGGGGIGMRLIRTEGELAEAYASVDRLARANFKDAGLYLEKYVEQARHVEVQIFGDGHGKVIALGERDCSVQRRNQKVIEETPAPNLADAVRAQLLETSVRLAQAVGYRSAGTVEFVLDAATGEFYFLEVNTRLQVEHGVTEEVTGVDLVEWMVKCASGDLPPLDADQARAARGLDPGAALCGRSGQEFPALQRHAHCGGISAQCARGDLGRAGHRSAALLRSDDREDHRARARSARRIEETFRMPWRTRAWPASRPISTICARSWRTRHSRKAGRPRACLQAWRTARAPSR